MSRLDYYETRVARFKSLKSPGPPVSFVIDGCVTVASRTGRAFSKGTFLGRMRDKGIPFEAEIFSRLMSRDPSVFLAQVSSVNFRKFSPKERKKLRPARFVNSTSAFARDGWPGPDVSLLGDVRFNDDLFSSVAFGFVRGCFVSQQEAIEFYFPTCACSRGGLLLRGDRDSEKGETQRGRAISSDVHNGRNALAFLMGHG